MVLNRIGSVLIATLDRETDASSLRESGQSIRRDVHRHHDRSVVLDFGAVWEIAVGFAVAFLTAVIVVRWVLRFISRNGYAMFGWWRIIVGSAALAAILFGF